ncbi:MAG: glycosyltransferase family 4 protein [Planctomycetaceae bacterium]|nr:glycosyltransferase family 4 protein [Planctomycetaceae bacterium]
MRILYHHRTSAGDGQGVHIRSLQRAFRELGHEVFEVSLVASDAETKPKEPQKQGSGGWNVMARLPRFARELAEYAYTSFGRPKIIAAANRHEPDFIYERYAFGNGAGVAAAQRLGLPLVLEVNSPMVLELSRTRGLSFPGTARRMEDWIWKSADRVCVVTQVLGDMVAERGVERSRIFVTPNGVHPEAYDYASDARECARTALGLGPEATGPVLGFVGFYREWHRLDLVLAALARPELASARLVLVGEGPAHEALVAQAATLGISERIHFAGPRPHDSIPALLPAFDLALVPAINPYASPLKLFEYMAAGLASIAPDQPNLREVLEQDRNALLVTPGDGESLRAALERLVNDVHLRERLGARARADVLERDLTWRGNARRVIEVATELVAERRRNRRK